RRISPVDLWRPRQTALSPRSCEDPIPATAVLRFNGGKSHRKASQSIARKPPALPCQLIKSAVQSRSVRRLSKRFFVVFPQPNDRLRPRGSISRITTGILPEYFPCPPARSRGNAPSSRMNPCSTNCSIMPALKLLPSQCQCSALTVMTALCRTCFESGTLC
ncbi:MAG: hypothetical protein JWM99_1098, partial [Verrucomicrobiales bacterium]|nr:hypothetical protein [Verrucomicrobiales bacterium]